LIIAFASGAELETQLEIALRLKYILLNEYEDGISLLHEVMKMLNALIQKFAESKN
jgi:four helix bundle protein